MGKYLQFALYQPRYIYVQDNKHRISFFHFKACHHFKKKVDAFSFAISYGELIPRRQGRLKPVPYPVIQRKVTLAQNGAYSSGIVF